MMPEASIFPGLTILGSFAGKEKKSMLRLPDLNFLIHRRQSVRNTAI